MYHSLLLLLLLLFNCLLFTLPYQICVFHVPCLILVVNWPLWRLHAGINQVT